MKIGLTRGTGFIGQIFIEEYGDSNEIIALTSRNVFNGLSAKAKYVVSDYSTESYLKNFYGCDAVVHLGGAVMHGMEKKIDIKPYLINLETTSNLLDACVLLGITNIVVASSVAVYKQISEVPTKETDSCEPNSCYGVIKIAVEKLCNLYISNKNLNVKILRFGQGIGLKSVLSTSDFWSLCLVNSTKGENICLYGKGITGRDVIYVKDMARSIICALDHPTLSGIYNIGSGSITSNFDIAEAYIVANGNKSIIKFIDKPESGIRTFMDCSKAKNELDFEVKYNLQKAVDEIVAKYKGLMN